VTEFHTAAAMVCLPDLLRGVRRFPEGFFDLVREPIRQGTGIAIGYPPTGRRPHGLLPGFSVAEFRALAGIGPSAFDDEATRQAHWASTYFRLSAAAVGYLFEHIPAGHHVLGFEMPPWLERACDQHGVSYLEMRASPLRFGRDLYVAVRTNRDDVARRLHERRVTDDELRLEAGLLRANVQMHRRLLESEGRHVFEDLDGVLLFIGQAPYDASLLAEHGHPCRADDFADRIVDACRGRRLMHKVHPFATQHADEQRGLLARITGQQPGACQQNAYQILSGDDAVTLIGISSGLLQEARWFDKDAVMLHRPYVDLMPFADGGGGAFQQVHFHHLLSPAFWHQLLAPAGPAPALAALPPLPHHHARETLDQWWDYSKVLTWERSLPYEAFVRSGGALLQQRVRALEGRLAEPARPDEPDHGD
jgi:hypothetical protein